MRYLRSPRFLLAAAALGAAAVSFSRRFPRIRLWPFPIYQAPAWMADRLCAVLPTRFCGHEVGVVGPLEKVQPSSAPHVVPGATLLAARNEFESFQIVIRAGRVSIDNVNVTVSAPLTGPTTIPTSGPPPRF